MANIDLNQYEKMYGYTIGKLINGDTSEEITKSEKAIFDNKSLNFHFYPSDTKVCKEIEGQIGDKIKEIEKIIKKIESSNEKGAITIKTKSEMEHMLKNNEEMTPNKIYFYVITDGQLKQNYKPLCKLFKYIGAVVNGNLYELNFMRFYIKDNKVNCIVKAMQFDRIVGNKNTKIIKETANKYGICYPNTDKHHKSLQNLINTNKNKNFFYNPPTKFDTNAEKILVAFVEFICECEDKNEELVKIKNYICKYLQKQP